MVLEESQEQARKYKRVRKTRSLCKGLLQDIKKKKKNKIKVYGIKSWKNFISFHLVLGAVHSLSLRLKRWEENKVTCNALHANNKKLTI